MSNDTEGGDMIELGFKGVQVRGRRRLKAASILLTLIVALLVFSLPAPGRLKAQSVDEIKRLIADAGDSGDYPGSDILYVFDRMDVTVEESGLAHFRSCKLIKVLTERGALREGVLRFDYDPSSNFIDVERVRVFRRDGSVEEIDTGSVKDLYAPAYMIYWGARMKLLSLPRLHPGDAVEIRTYKKGFEIAYLSPDAIKGIGEAFLERYPGGLFAQAVPGVYNAGSEGYGDGGGVVEDERYIPPMRGHFYDVVLFQGTDPIKEKRYDLHLPKDKPVQFKVYNGTLFCSQNFDSTHVNYSWWLRDVPALKREPHMPNLSDVVTKLVLTTVPSWEEKSRWFASIHDTIFNDNEAIRRKVRGITKGLKGDLDKVRALQHWAAQEIRYSGISMGKGEGYTIHPGTMIFHDRCGVCKDKAGMLITLMRSAGFEVYPALTMAGARVEEVPADQFNHCVVAWRHADGTYTMLDPTWVPYSTELWSSAEQEQHYVIGTPWGEGLRKTPYSPPENHVVKLESRATIREDGTLYGKIRITATNYMDQRLRRYVGTHRKDDLKAFIEKWLSNISPWVEVEDVRIGDPLDFHSEFFLDVRYRAGKFAVLSKDTIDFISPVWSLVFGNRYLFPSSTYIEAETRDYPLFIWFTQAVQCEEKVSLPGRFRVAVRENESRDGEYASFEARISPRGRTVSSDGRILIKHRLIPADAYEDFRSTILGAREFTCRRIIARR